MAYACSVNKAKGVTRRIWRRKTVFTACLFSFLFLGSNANTYAKTGETWIAKVWKLTTGNGVEVTVKEYDTGDPNVAHSEVTINADQQKDYCFVKDGRLILDFNGEKQDITGICSEGSYFSHEYKDESGFRHLIIAGGGTEDPGWAEYIFDVEGICTFNLYSDSIVVDIEPDADQTDRITKINEVQDGDSVTEVYSFVYEEAEGRLENDKEQVHYISLPPIFQRPVWENYSKENYQGGQS